MSKAIAAARLIREVWEGEGRNTARKPNPILPVVPSGRGGVEKQTQEAEGGGRNG